MKAANGEGPLRRRYHNFGVLRARFGRIGRRPMPPGTAGLVVLIAMVTVILVLRTGARLDAASVEWAHRLPNAVTGFFAFVTRYGKSDWILFPSGILVIVLLFSDWTRVPRRIAAAWAEIGALSGALFIAVAGSGITVDIIKVLVGRERPMLFGMDGAFAFDPFTFDYATNSFPSGHATTAGALAAFLVLLAPRLAVPAVGFGLLVALSRVIVGAHYPSDIVTGFVFGASYTYFLAKSLARGRFAYGGGRIDAPFARTVAIRSVLARPGGVTRLAAGLGAAVTGLSSGRDESELAAMKADAAGEGDGIA